MKKDRQWLITDEEKEKLIKNFTKELVSLRVKADISQSDIASLIGVSRQTYGSFERGTRVMTWNTYLSLILFYDYNSNTHQMIRDIGAFPVDVMKTFTDSDTAEKIDVRSFLSEGIKDVVERLDEQALRNIRTLIMLEYARCTNTPGDEVVKAFNGVSFEGILTSEAKTAVESLRSIKGRRRKGEKK